MGIDMEKQRREQIRWQVLQTLNVARPYGANEELILQVVNDIKLNVSLQELRRELDYLKDRELISLEGINSPVWLAELTRAGVDYVEYTIDSQPGIARPKKYF